MMLRSMMPAECRDIASVLPCPQTSTGPWGVGHRDMDLYQPPSAAPADPAATGASTGQRIAGVLLIVHGILVLVESMYVPELPGLPGGEILCIPDFVLGLALVVNLRRASWGALGWVVLGVVLQFAVYVDSVPRAILGTLDDSAFLLLLIGRAGALRIAAGCVTFGLHAAMMVLGLIGIATGQSALARPTVPVNSDLEEISGGELAGVASDYRIRVASDRWRLRSAAATRRELAEADRWIVRPDLDAHLIVIDERAPGVALHPVEIADDLIAELQTSELALRVENLDELIHYADDGLLIAGQGRSQGHVVSVWIGVVAVYGRAYQIFGLAPPGRIEAADEIVAMIGSFRLPADEPPLPNDVEPAPAGRVLGVASPYAITAPSDRWHLRKPGPAQADNPDVDRWLARPDTNAHIAVIVEDEDEDGLPVDLAEYAEVIRESLQEDMPGAVIGPPRPLAGHARDGRTIHVEGLEDGHPIVLDIGLFVAGRRAFQVVGTAFKPFYPKVEADLRRAIESFEPPPVPARRGKRRGAARSAER